MYSLTDIMYWVSLPEIILAFFIAFYIPGRVILGNHKIEQKNAVHVLAVIIGVALWAWQGYLFGMVHLRWMSYLYLIIFAGLFVIKKYYRGLRFSLPSVKKVDLIIVLIGIVGIFGQIIPYLQMGLKTQDGVVLMSINRDDHVWHAGLVSELVDRFPPNEPAMAGVVLKDYHYWFNLITADIIRVFHLPPFQTQFMGMYPLASFLLLFLGYYLARLIYDKKIFVRLFLFFLFFSGDAALWAMLIWQHKFTASVSSLINNGTKFVDSPAFAYSMLIGLAGFYLLFQAKEKLSKRLIIVIALLFGSLLELKVYTGLTFMLGLGGFACFAFFKKRFDTVWVFVLAGILGAVTFFPNTSPGGGLLFIPFEIPRDFISQKVLGLHDWELRWWIYQDHANYLRVIQYGIYMSLVYLAIQFGIQLIGLFPSKRLVKTLSFERAIPLYIIIISGMILGLFFYQKIGGANVWEFFLPAIIILSLLTSLTIALLLEKAHTIIKVIVVCLIVIIIIPRWFLTVTFTFSNEYLYPFHGISNDENASYQYLHNAVSKDAVTLFADDNHNVAYVSYAKMLSGAQLYWSGEGVRQKETPEILKRRAVAKEVKYGTDNRKFELLKREHIGYLYYYGPVPHTILSDKRVRVVFQNKAATIVRLDL